MPTPFSLASSPGLAWNAFCDQGDMIMQTHTAYCSACDRDVRIVVTDEPSQDGHANLHDSEIVCLEIGHQCTGGMCPIGATSSTVMAARLVRNGLQTRMQPIVTRKCPSCDGPTSSVIIDRTQSVCTVCGTTFRSAGPLA